MHDSKGIEKLFGEGIYPNVKHICPECGAITEMKEGQEAQIACNHFKEKFVKFLKPPISTSQSAA